MLMQLFPAFLLVLCRITAFFVVAPVFSSRNVPGTFKIGIGFFVSVLVFLSIGFDTRVVADGLYVLSIMREVLAGLLIGYVAYLFFTVMQIAGAFMDLSIGFGIANVVDPITGVNAPMLGNFKYMLTILVFLSLNGHHYLLAAIMDSYKWLPLDNALYAGIAEGGLADFLVRTFADTFRMALQIAAPIMVAMFLTEVGLGLLARTAPQFNVFVVGIPVKILVGLAMLVVLMPGFSALFQMMFNAMLGRLDQLFALFQNVAR